jgi:hypothetical protein
MGAVNICSHKSLRFPAETFDNLLICKNKKTWLAFNKWSDLEIKPTTFKPQNQVFNTTSKRSG